MRYTRYMDKMGFYSYRGIDDLLSIISDMTGPEWCISLTMIADPSEHIDVYLVSINRLLKGDKGAHRRKNEIYVKL